MIAEGGASVSVDLELVLAPGVLRGEAAHCSSVTGRPRLGARPGSGPPLPSPQQGSRRQTVCAPLSEVTRWAGAPLPHRVLRGCPFRAGHWMPTFPLFPGCNPHTAGFLLKLPLLDPEPSRCPRARRAVQTPRSCRIPRAQRGL